jgi:predicted transglutaminase-like cysteine proteinase
MKAAATIKTAGGTKATAANLETTTSATVETATSATMKAAATATMKTTATAAARLGYVCERESHDCARQDRRERQRDLFEAPSSQHTFLHLN